MKTFKQLYEIACKHKGGSKMVESLLPKAKSKQQLIKQADSYYLSQMSLRIFRAGLKHEMVDNKWPAFEDVFQCFDPFYCAMLSDENIEQLMQDKRLIRHMGKIKSVRENGAFVANIQREYQSFGHFLADWPDDDVVSLWIYLKKNGRQLGGISGAYFLRMVGKDTFLLTGDVVTLLINEGVLHKEPSAQRDFKAAQDAFRQWRDESGRSFCEISRLASFTATLPS